MQETIDGIETREQERIKADIQRDKRISRNETILRELCDQSKRNNICIIGVPEEEEREKGIESVFEEIIAENFPELGGGNSCSDYRGTQNSRETGPKEDNTKTHNN